MDVNLNIGPGKKPKDFALLASIIPLLSQTVIINEYLLWGANCMYVPLKKKEVQNSNEILTAVQELFVTAINFYFL